ncbi:MAG: TIGR03668 family PPOX class F420-dependent oxidoreductase [Candidatus Rokuibacteriota bacterium]
MQSSPAAPLTPPVVGFITSARVGRLATADAAGQPLVVPICYAFDGGALYSAVDAKPKQLPPERLKRIRNLRENPRVSVVIDEYEEDWTRLRYVIIQGRADLLTDGPQFAHGVDLLTAKYAQYRTLGLPRERGLMIRVTPHRVSSWQYSS